MKPKLLVVDDDETIRYSLTALFEEEGYEVEELAEGRPAIKLFGDSKRTGRLPDLVLLDVQLPDISGLKVLEKISEEAPSTPVIIITGFGSVPQSVEAMKKGAEDYVLKPFNADELKLRIAKALKNQNLKEQVGFLKKKVYGNWDEKYTLGPNPAMRKLYEKVAKVGASPSTTVLILGETGTGKEVVAQRVHQASARKDKPFVAVNATALTPELLESELFGHEAGSFTGAAGLKKGLVEIADGGTLFLDEIGDMDPALQSKLLRVLQERTIRRVGGTDYIEVDIRLIAATNKNLEKAVAKGEFREDLYYRLNVVPVEIPPLRDRLDDIEALSMHFIREFNTEFQKGVQKIAPAALDALKAHPWPGNIRELRNLIERTMLLEVDGATLESHQLKFGTNVLRQQPTDGSPHLGETVALEIVERQHIEGVLEGTNGNKNQAAQILGIDRTTLYNKLKKYQISADR